MTPKRMRNNSRFFLKVRNRGTFLKQAGTKDTGEGETHPAAETTRRLSEAQGFPSDYIIDVDADGKVYPKSEQVARCGNAVCPPIPTALVRANLPDLCHTEASA